MVTQDLCCCISMSHHTFHPEQIYIQRACVSVCAPHRHIRAHPEGSFQWLNLQRAGWVSPAGELSNATDKDCQITPGQKLNNKGLSARQENYNNPKTMLVHNEKRFLKKQLSLAVGSRDSSSSGSN